MAKTSEYGLGPLTFPRGWFMIAEASEIADKPVPLHAPPQPANTERFAGAAVSDNIVP